MSVSMAGVGAPIASLNQYLRAVEGFPRLDADEERALAVRFRQDNDLEAAWKLVTSHLRYVVYVARGYRGYGLPLEDLIQEGNMGLMKAVKRYDPGRHVRLLSYAIHWVRAQIHDFILKNWRLVKFATTKARRKLFYRLRGEKERLQWLSRDEAREIADALNVRPEDVTDVEASLYLPEVSLSAPPDDHGEGPWAASLDTLADDAGPPEIVVSESELLDRASEALVEALAGLDGRSREIIERRWLTAEESRWTLQQLGEHLGISAERVRQLERRTLERLRERLQAELDADVTETNRVRLA